MTRWMDQLNETDIFEDLLWARQLSRNTRSKEGKQHSPFLLGTVKTRSEGSTGSAGVFYHLSPNGTDFDNHPCMGIPLCKTSSPAEKFQHTIKASKKKSRLDAIKMLKISYALPALPLP